MNVPIPFMSVPLQKFVVPTDVNSAYPAGPLPKVLRKEEQKSVLLVKFPSNVTQPMRALLRVLMAQSWQKGGKGVSWARTNSADSARPRMHERSILGTVDVFVLGVLVFF